MLAFADTQHLDDGFTGHLDSGNAWIRSLPAFPIDVRNGRDGFYKCGMDTALIAQVSIDNHYRDLFAKALDDAHTLLGRYCYQTLQAGFLTRRQARDALLSAQANLKVKGCRARNTADVRINALIEIGVWTEDPDGVLRHPRWSHGNPDAAEFARRLDMRRQYERLRKRAQRRAKGVRPQRGRPRKIGGPSAQPLKRKRGQVGVITGELNVSPPSVIDSKKHRPEKPRASALHPDSPSSSTASFTSHRPPHIGPWVPRQPPPVPPRPFTDTDLDSLADELDAETKRLARRRQRGESSGGPPATPEPPGWKAVFSSPAPASEDPSPPQAPPSPSPEAPSNTEVPRSPTELRALMHAAGAAGNYDAMTRYADLLEAASASPPAQAPRPERSVAIAEDKKKDEPKPVPAPAVSPRSGPRQSPVLAAATPPATLATPETLRALERHHGVSGFNTQAAINLRVTHDTARQAFEIGMEARARGKGGRGPSVGDLRRYILGTMRKLSAGWGPLPRGP